jgi:hypothetical protein
MGEDPSGVSREPAGVVPDSHYTAGIHWQQNRGPQQVLAVLHRTAARSACAGNTWIEGPVPRPHVVTGPFRIGFSAEPVVLPALFRSCVRAVGNLTHGIDPPPRTNEVRQGHGGVPAGSLHAHGRGALRRRAGMAPHTTKPIQHDLVPDDRWRVEEACCREQTRQGARLASRPGPISRGPRPLHRVGL